jgi:exodeoxyribonuclease VII small subunit
MSEEETSFETKLARLQEIVSRLEQEDLSLEEGVNLFQEGSRLAKECREHLHNAEHRIRIYSQGVLQDYQPEEAESDGSADNEADLGDPQEER